MRPGLECAVSMQGSACSVCASQTHMAYEVEPMLIALKTSTTLSACGECVPQSHTTRSVKPMSIALNVLTELQD